MPELGWTYFHVPNAQTRFYSFFEKLDILYVLKKLLTQQGDGGLRLLPIWHILPSLGGSGSLFNILLRGQSLTNGIMKIFLPPLRMEDHLA